MAAADAEPAALAARGLAGADRGGDGLGRDVQLQQKVTGDRPARRLNASKLPISTPQSSNA